MSISVTSTVSNTDSWVPLTLRGDRMGTHTTTPERMGYPTDHTNLRRRLVHVSDRFLTTVTRLPSYLHSYWDERDNWDEEGNLVCAEEFDGFNNYMASWFCPDCNDFWKATISSMKQRTRKHQEKYGAIYPCKFCNPNSDKGNWDAHGAKRCHIDGRDSVETQFPDVATQWATIVIDGVIYPLNDLGPDEIVAGKQKIILRCNQIVDSYGKIDTKSDEECRHLRPVRIRTACNPGGQRNAHGCGACSKGGNDVNNFDGRNGLPNTNPELAAEFISSPRGVSVEEIKCGSPDCCTWRCGNIDRSAESANRWRDLAGAHLELGNLDRVNQCNNWADIIEDTGLVCGHIFDREVNARSKNCTPGYKSQCPVCDNDEVHEDGRNSLATLFPYISLDWDYDLNELTPSEVCPGWSAEDTKGNTTHGEFYWRCAQTHENSVCDEPSLKSLYSRTQTLIDFAHLSYRNCGKCNPGKGFNNSRDGYYYTLRVTGLSDVDASLQDVIYKNGISNNPRYRMRKLSESLNDTHPNCYYTLESIHLHPPSPVEKKVRTLEESLKSIAEIRVKKMKFDGGNELFTVNGFSYAMEHDMIDFEHWNDVSNEWMERLNQILHRPLNS